METIGLLVFLVVIGTFAWGAHRGAPWVPTWGRDTARILTLAGVRPGHRVVDLGCGSGGVLRAFADAGCAVRGWELAIVPWLVAWLRLRRYARAVVTYGDFWRADLRDVDVIYAFLMPRALTRLAAKLRAELTTGSRVITYAFPLPGWDPVAIDRVDGRPPLYRYQQTPAPTTRRYARQDNFELQRSREHRSPERVHTTGRCVERCC